MSYLQKEFDMKQLYVPELVEKLDQLVIDGVLGFEEYYYYKFPFSTETIGVFKNPTDSVLYNFKHREEMKEVDKDWHINFVQIFVYRKRGWSHRTNNDTDMQNYSEDFKLLKSVDTIIKDIKRVYRVASEVWSASKENDLIKTISAL